MSEPYGQLVQIPSSGGALKAYTRDGELVVGGPAFGATFVSGVSNFVRIPPLWKLRLTGSGTCTIDARDSLGNITTGVETFSASGATDQIEFPYAGDDAVEARFTLTGTCTAEII